jgi:hypothetical protein
MMVTIEIGSNDSRERVLHPSHADNQHPIPDWIFSAHKALYALMIYLLLVVYTQSRHLI